MNPKTDSHLGQHRTSIPHHFLRQHRGGRKNPLETDEFCSCLIRRDLKHHQQQQHITQGATAFRSYPTFIPTRAYLEPHSSPMHGQHHGICILFVRDHVSSPRSLHVVIDSSIRMAAEHDGEATVDPSVFPVGLLSARLRPVECDIPLGRLDQFLQGTRRFCRGKV